MRFLESAYIEITNRCNLRCSFCPGTTRSPEFMEKELFEKILVELQGNTRFIFFHVMGEPLLHPQLKTFFSLAAQYRHRVNLTTNGILLTDKSDILKNAAALRQVNISLHWLSDMKDKEYIFAYMKMIAANIPSK